MVAINFSPQFAEAVAAGRKTQTIRQSARATTGRALQLYTGQRTKDCRKLADAVCVDCTSVKLTARGATLGDTSRFPGDRDDFARADGFEDYAAMWKWFSERYETHSFAGYIIRWRLERGTMKDQEKKRIRVYTYPLQSRSCDRRSFCGGLKINGRCPDCGWADPAPISPIVKH